MVIVNKLFNGLALRCLGAIFAGVAIVAIFIALLHTYGDMQEPVSKTMLQSIKFPENEKMLDDMAAQLAREREALPDIAPASGKAEPDSPGN